MASISGSRARPERQSLENPLPLWHSRAERSPMTKSAFAGRSEQLVAEKEKMD